MKYCGSVLVFTVFISGVLTAQDWNIIGAGTRAEGMGGAFIGVANDVTALMWNPAGLSQLTRPEASVVLSYVERKTEVSSSHGAGYEYTGYEYTLIQSHRNMNFAGVAVPFSLGTISVVAAAAFQRQLDLNAIETYFNNKGGVSTFSPGISIRMSPVFAVGAAANFWTGTGTMSGEGYRTGYSYTITSPNKGFNMVFGAMLDLNALSHPLPVKFGLTIRTPFTLKSDGIEHYSYNNDHPDEEYANKQFVQMPLMVGMGTSIRITEQLTVSAEYEIRLYGDREITIGNDHYYYIGVYVETSKSESESRRDLHQLRAGAEYMIPAGQFSIPLRAGFRTVPTLMANLNQTPEMVGSGRVESTGQVIGKAFTFGTGLATDHIAVDLSYSTTDYTKHDTEGYPGYRTSLTKKYSTGTFGASLTVYL